MICVVYVYLGGIEQRRCTETLNNDNVVYCSFPYKNYLIFIIILCVCVYVHVFLKENVNMAGKDPFL